MRAPCLFPLLLLSACAETAPPVPDLQSRQEAACAAAIAAHVGRPESQISARWLSEQDGKAQIETLDGGRRHICEVDASGRVLGYSHPDA
jgi:hypothetical protein